MDYEKKYKEALERAKSLIGDTIIEESGQHIAEVIFPELAESEDEKIRKAIHIYLDWLDGRKDYQPKGDYTIKDMLAWLEKQGEQKPADKVEPFDKYEGLTDFERTLADICIGWIGEELGWKQYIKDNADVLLKIAVEKFNSVQDVPFEQKSAWSEEDEVKINRIVACLENLNVADNDILLKDVDWLKSLKDRVQPQPNQEWSEEDEKIAKTIINEFEQSSEWYCANGLTKEDCIAWVNKQMHTKWSEEDKKKVNNLYVLLDQMVSFNMLSNKDATEFKDWLKSLRPQNTWKPSDEQMEVLKEATSIVGSKYKSCLNSLYSDLKKLKD